VGFILGESADPELNLRLVNENDEYGDIIQGEFLDSYRNLSFKSMVAWRWIKHNCMNAKFVLKIDDDVFVNTRSLLDFIRNRTRFDPPRHAMAGMTMSTGPIRAPGHMWYVSKEEFPDNSFPTYMNGPASLFTRAMPALLYKHAFTTKDLWITVILYFIHSLKSSKILGLTVLRTHGMECWLRRSTKPKCTTGGAIIGIRLGRMLRPISTN
jgi:beta-1,3-galactosyltransferase 1